MDLVEALSVEPNVFVQRDKPSVPKANTPGYWEWDGNTGVLNTQPTAETITTWDEYIRDSGLDPNEVEVVEPVQVRGWDSPVGEGNVVRMHYYRLTLRLKRKGPSTDEILADLQKYRKKTLPVSSQDASAFVVAIGDLQLGKIDGDGPEGTVARAVEGLYEAAERLKGIRRYKNVGPVHLAWLGDCIEGFVSQGGANAWRTSLTVTEQLKVLRKLMLEAILVFAPLTDELSVVAVPGNHDQAIRFGKNGVTTYDDSFDTDALRAIEDACRLAGDKFSHVTFNTPDRDELTVTVDVAGTKLGHIHGHQTKSRQHFKWWAEQSLGDQQVGQADVLLAGHFHHFILDTSGKRKFIQVPALEAESTWYRHQHGETGDPGILTFVTKDGVVNNIEIV